MTLIGLLVLVTGALIIALACIPSLGPAIRGLEFLRAYAGMARGDRRWQQRFALCAGRGAMASGIQCG